MSGDVTTGREAGDPVVKAAPRPTDDRSGGSALRWLGGLGLLALAATIAGLVLGGGAELDIPEGVRGPGPVVVWGYPVLRLAWVMAATATVGLLLYAAVLGPQGRRGVLSKVGRRDAVLGAWLAGAWAVISGLTAVWALAWALGEPIVRTVGPDILLTYGGSLSVVRAFAICGVLAAVVAVGLIFTSSVSATAGWLLLCLFAVGLPALTGHSSGLGDHSLATTSDVAHAIAMPVWVGGLVVLLVHGMRGDPGMANTVRVFRVVASWSFVILAVSGLGAAYARMSSVSELWTTGFGRLVLIKLVLLGLLLVSARTLQTRVADVGSTPGRKAVLRFGAIEAALMALAAGIGVALTQTAYPRQDLPLATAAEELLGQPFPPAPTAARVLFGWQTEPLFLAMAVVAIGLYLGGVIRLRRRGDSWSVLRTASWILGWAGVVWATSGGVAIYATVSMTYHMLSHMALGMCAPILMAMSAPMTLALRALPPATGGRRGPREWLVWAMHTKLARFITHPLWVLFVFTIGLYGLYYTPLFGWLMSTHVGHVAMQLHFIASGYLFAWVVIQTDPLPRSLPPWGRLIMVAIAMLLHTLFALPIMMSGTAFGAEWYARVQPPWLPDLVADSQTAGGVAWGIAELPTLLLIVAVGVQWARSDSKEAERHDRQAERDGDADMAAYNERLRKLYERDQAQR